MKGITKAIFWLLIALIVVILLLALYFNFGKQLIAQLAWEKLLS